MRIQIRTVLALLVASSMLASGKSQAANVVGGQTNVALDTALLASAANLTLSGVSPDVIAPGSIPNSVAFTINPRNAAILPTTFSYDPATFPAAGSFSGTIEHQGSVFFNANAVEVGDFTIGFSAARAGTLGGQASGFYVASTTGIAAILFDLKVNSANPQPTSLSVGADLLVSPEFGSFLFSGGLSTTNLQGADVGNALVAATAVPEPAGIALVGVALAAWGFVGIRRR
jgi:hypothetical protein